MRFSADPVPRGVREVIEFIVLTLTRFAFILPFKFKEK